MPQTAKQLEAALSEAKELAGLIAGSLPEKVEAAALTFNSKVPFKALSLRELLIHRVAALAGPAVDLFEQRSLVAAIILTRGVIETVAVTFALHKALQQFLASKDVLAFDKFLVQTLMGSRWPDAEHQSANILTLVRHVEKHVEGFEASYNALSEYAHPNWAGVLGAFGVADRDNLELRLGPNSRTSAFASGIFALTGSLKTFNHFYNDMIDMLYEINSYFESQGGDNAA